MIKIVKEIIKRTPLYSLFRKWIEKRNQIKVMREWEKNGRPVPPPHIVKQRTLLYYAKAYKLKVLVETGTYYGDMVDAMNMKRKFHYIYSIELSKELFDKAKRRFKKVRNVELIHGDSGNELGNVMKKIDQPALFWLDGHYSAGVTARGEKDTPIYEELSNILSGEYKGHVIIIDDARCFGTDPAYPTINELKRYINSKRQNLEIIVQDDSIRITPVTSVLLIR